MSFLKLFILPLALVFAFVFGINTVFQKAQAQITPAPIVETGKGFAVVELFTSEGCSSCPPAEAHLNDLVAFQEKNPDVKLYPLAFHVDYWDYIGWEDRFAQEKFTNRQRSYNLQKGRSGIYTPQMFVNGTKQFVGSQRAKGAHIINQFLNDENRSAPTLTLKQSTPNAGRINVSYRTTGPLKNQHAIVVAIVEKDLVTEVKRGENRGRTLTHQNVVRYLQSEKATDSGSMTLEYPARDNLSLIGFIQDRHTHQIVAATQTDL